MELALAELRSLLKNEENETAYEVGTKYLVRCVTMFYTGRLKRITPGELVFEDASWIADTGRFHDALKTGDLREVEPFIEEVIIPRTAIIDASKWNHDLPRNQK